MRVALHHGRALLIVWVIWALAALRPARAAEPQGVELSAPPGCPGSVALSAAIRDLVGHDFDPAGFRLHVVRQEAVGKDAAWQALLTLPEGQRRLDGESCAAVMDAAAVVVALSLEPRTASEQSAVAPPSASAANPAAAPPVDSLAAAAEPGPARPAAPVAAAARVPSPPLEAQEASFSDAAVPASPSREPLHLMLQVGVMGEVGLLPAPSLGPRLRVTIESGPWSVDLGGAMLLPRHAELSTGESGEFYWFGGQLSACRAVGERLRACLGGEAGEIMGTGSGVDEPLAADGSWAAVTAEASFRGSISEPLAWELGLGAAAALLLPEFGFDQLGVLHRPSSVSGRLFASVALR